MAMTGLAANCECQRTRLNQMDQRIAAPCPSSYSACGIVTCVVRNDHAGDDHLDAVRELVERLPQWLRADLSATDVAARKRAEDVLRAMIVAAISAASTIRGRL